MSAGMIRAVVVGTLALIAGVVVGVKTRRLRAAPVLSAATMAAVVWGSWAIGLLHPSL